MNEAEIIINDITLTTAQSMAVRVAVGAYYAEMQEENALGSDDQGKRLAKAYSDRLAEVLRAIGGF